jgi:hypothetical protein
LGSEENGFLIYAHLQRILEAAIGKLKVLVNVVEEFVVIPWVWRGGRV